MLPGTPAIRQELTAFGRSGPVTLWKAVKTNFDHNGELHGRPLDLICRIDEEPHGDGPAWGTCREAGESPVVASGSTTVGDVIRPRWEWPAGRPVEVRLLVQIHENEPARPGFLGIRNAPSLAGSLPDPHQIVGTVLYGPAPFPGRDVSLRVPGAEAEVLTVGEVAAFGLIEGGQVVVCVAPVPEGNRDRRQAWLEHWECQ